MFGLGVPFSTLQEESVNVAAIFRFFLNIARLNIEIFEFKREFVNGDDMLAGIVLECASEEGLREEKA